MSYGKIGIKALVCINKDILHLLQLVHMHNQVNKSVLLALQYSSVNHDTGKFELLEAIIPT